jgi:hypothetical protein
MKEAQWTDADFSEMSWHDVHVHGFRVVEGEHGEGELLLDIDYIMEWLENDEGFMFRIAPALLQFHEMTKLRLELDYARASAGIVPFSLGGLKREPITYPNGYTSFRWELEVNWPNGSIAFEAPRFTQSLSGPEVTSKKQWLLSPERSRAD